MKPSSRPRLRKALRLGLYLLLGVISLLTTTGVWLYRRADARVLHDLTPRTINDVTQLNPTQVAEVATPKSAEDISALLRSTTGPVSIGGARCSMGGQVAEPGSLHLDLRQMNRVIRFEPAQRSITVQAGITWRDIQDVIDPHDLAIKIMQTYANFTVGGALSVNAHGRYMGRGPVVQSVKRIKLVLASGEIVEASPEQRSELFYGAIGGYGGLGVIAEATLDLVPNGKIERQTATMDTSAYPQFFDTHIRSAPSVVFHNADLHPPAFDTLRAVSWVESERELTEPARLIPRGDVYTWTPRLINGSVSFPFGLALRKHVLEPIFYASAAVTFRNHEASYDIAEIEPESRADSTFVLREYFIPAEKFLAFVPKMRDIFSKHEVPVVNVSVRHASEDPGTLLAWARGETFAFVVYYEQGTSKEAIAQVGEWSRELVDAVLAVGGTYYLPYQNHATLAQFKRAYPRSEEYFALKRKVDPALRFQNSLFYSYGTSPRAELARELAEAYDQKPEGQTLLTVPEWYLVFNPLEYAEYLERGHPGDGFPFLASVEEYWSQYKRVRALSEGNYPDNPEYLTMLQVIGVSTTVEFLIKGAYESTLGWLARMTSDGTASKEDATIAQAHRAYSDLIYHEPWYAFDFLPWVGKVWQSDLLGPNFLRRTERKLAFSLEFAVKAAYAELLGYAARSAYDAPVEEVHLLVRAERAEDLQVDPRVKLVRALTQGRYLVAVPRWGPFTEIVPEFAERGVEVLEIAGNDDIVMSVVGPKASVLPAQLGVSLFESKLVTDRSKKRSVLLVPTQKLSQALRMLRAANVRLEHLYDY